MDGVIEEFTVRRKTVRWPMLIAYNIIDVSWNNAFILMSKCGYRNSRKHFLRNLSFQMAHAFASHRLLRKKLSQEIRMSGLLHGWIYVIGGVRKRWHFWTTSCFVMLFVQKWSRSRCSKCCATICPRHRFQVKREYCENCKWIDRAEFDNGWIHVYVYNYNKRVIWMIT